MVNKINFLIIIIIIIMNNRFNFINDQKVIINHKIKKKILQI